MTSAEVEGDVYQVSMDLKAADNEYAAFPEYAEKTLALRRSLNSTASRAAIHAGDLYKSMKKFVDQNPGEKGQKRIELFVKANAANYYGKKAQKLLTPKAGTGQSEKQ
jgi:hypothetical protein